VRRRPFGDVQKSELTMAQQDVRTTWRLQAVTRGQSEELPAAAQQAFEAAAEQMERPGAFESRAIAVDGQAFTALTGFNPQTGEFISPDAVRRGAEAATPARTRALGNSRATLRNDYIALGVFLRVCAAHTLGLKAELHGGVGSVRR
jgi:hypothetical protein